MREIDRHAHDRRAGEVLLRVTPCSTLRTGSLQRADRRVVPPFQNTTVPPPRTNSSTARSVLSSADGAPARHQSPPAAPPAPPHHRRRRVHRRRVRALRGEHDHVEPRAEIARLATPPARSACTCSRACRAATPSSPHPCCPARPCTARCASAPPPVVGAPSMRSASHSQLLRPCVERAASTPVTHVPRRRRIGRRVEAQRSTRGERAIDQPERVVLRGIERD